MTLETIADILLWCGLINIGLLLWWLLLICLAHDWVYRFHSRWFYMPMERFDAIHYAGMAFYKILMIVFNWVPYFAIQIIL